jgi:hypothetical protein
MLLSEAIALAEDGRPHDFEFVSKGNSKTKREGGYIVRMDNAVLTSSNNQKQKMNIKGLESGQIRWCYYVLLIRIDGQEVFI